jgi:esterase/lipase
MISTANARTTLYEFALQTPIEDGIDQIEAALLVIGGGKDKIAPSDETQMIFDKALSPDKKLIMCPGAGHCLYEMMPSLRYEIAQWIKQRA